MKRQRPFSPGGKFAGSTRVEKCSVCSQLFLLYGGDRIESHLLSPALSETEKKGIRKRYKIGIGYDTCPGSNRAGVKTPDQMIFESLCAACGRKFEIGRDIRKGRDPLPEHQDIRFARSSGDDYTRFGPDDLSDAPICKGSGFPGRVRPRVEVRGGSIEITLK